MSVVTCLTGGLGNQMFQYAIGYSVAKRNNDDFYIDISQFEYGKRKYALGDFKISAKTLNVKPATKNTKIHKMFARMRRLGKTGLFTTKFFQEDPDKIYEYAYPNIMYKHSIYLNGFWQSWRYFDEYRDELLNEFIYTSDRIGGEGYDELVKEVSTCESVAVHIRRGDYVECDGWLINPQFYKDAIARIHECIKGKLKFFVFCEDEKFARQLFGNMDYTMITGKFGLSDVEEFCVMSACKHKIISNSSFSWWAAYLGMQDADCMVIAPAFKQWKKEFYLPIWRTIDLNKEGD